MDIRGESAGRRESGDVRVYGEPYEARDGTTVITVSRLHRRRGAEPIPVPVGVFATHEGQTTWLPALDRTRTELLAEVIGLSATIIGLSSAVIATVAVLRRPPWPDLSNYRR